MATFAVIVAAAGKSSRYQDAHYKKPFAPLDNRPVWLHSVEKFLARDDVKQLVVVISPDDREMFFSKYGANVAILGLDVIEGGRERADSIRNGLAHVRSEIDFVAVHDAARPCLAAQWLDQVFEAAAGSGAATLAIPIAGTIKKVGADHRIERTVDRTGLWEAQTPQVFRRRLLVDAYAAYQGPPPTDDAQVVEATGHPITVVPGSPMNLKITTKEDLRFAAQALKALPKPKAFGPAHPFADDDMWR